MMTSLGFLATDAFPGEDGGMLVTLYEGTEYLAFRIEIDGYMTYSRETGDVEVEEREMCTLPQAIEILQAYRTAQSMSEDAAVSAPATLRFPNTRLTAERLWTSSALSVLRTREQETQAAWDAHDDPRWLLYRDAVAVFEDLLAELTWQEAHAHD